MRYINLLLTLTNTTTTSDCQTKSGQNSRKSAWGRDRWP